MSESMLELCNVAYRRNDNQILDGIDLSVNTGEHWALLGPNEAGKSTLLGFCGAQTHPTSGTVDVLGHRLGHVDVQELRRDIGHVNPRHPLRSPLSVTEVVLTGITGTIDLPLRWTATATQLGRARELIACVGLEHHEQATWPLLSQGERGRVLIARALASDPRLLLLDEPTTGLDVAAREQLLETIDSLPTCIRSSPQCSLLTTSKNFPSRQRTRCSSRTVEWLRAAFLVTHFFPLSRLFSRHKEKNAVTSGGTALVERSLAP